MTKKEMIKFYLWLDAEISKNADVKASDLFIQLGNQLIDKGVDIPSLFKN